MDNININQPHSRAHAFWVWATWIIAALNGYLLFQVLWSVYHPNFLEGFGRALVLIFFSVPSIFLAGLGWMIYFGVKKQWRKFCLLLVTYITLAIFASHTHLFSTFFDLLGRVI